jgi:hypothetical protein
VKQGTIHKQILYVDPSGIVRHTTEDIPFMATVDIPGVDPDNSFLEIQNHLLNIDTDYTLIPGTANQQATLIQKVVADILVKVSEWTQMDVVTQVEIYPKINHTGMYHCKPHPKPYPCPQMTTNLFPLI